VGTLQLNDMPGLGYAKVPGAEGRRGLTFLEPYAAERPQLRLLVHLVDGQVGPMETDLAIMRMVTQASVRASADAASSASDAGSSADGCTRDRKQGDDAVQAVDANDAEAAGGCRWSYAVVLTKSDKGGSGVTKRVRHAVERAVEETGCPEPVAVVPTSAKSKAGRHAMWRLLLETLRLR